MRRFIALFLVFVASALAAGIAAPAADPPLLSTMQNISQAVTETRGYYLTPAVDLSGGIDAMSLAPVQAFEIIRPGAGALTISRLYTSCTCVQLSAHKRAFGRGERIVLELHNIHPTPPNGQVYALYVQVTSPIRATLRYDTFLQSSQFVIKPEPEPEAIPDSSDETSSPSDQEDAGTAETSWENANAAPAGDTETAEGEDAAREQFDAPPALSGAVDQRVSMITLGVSDLTRARMFYEAIGWKPVARHKYDGIIFFQLNGQALSLYPLADLVNDMDMAGQEPRPGGAALGISVHSKDEVQGVYQAFLDAGGKSLKEPREMPWGSVNCYVADPDGHPWEISWVPQMPINADGELWIQ